MSVSIKEWGKLPDGRTAHLYTFTGSEISFTISDFGGTITSIIAPDSKGNMCDVTLGYDTLEEYIANDGHVGVMVGRYANRIAGAKITINGVEYKLTANVPPNQLHGGNGYHKRLWEAVSVGEDSITLRLLSPDGDDGYPGNLDVRITVSLHNNRIDMDFTAVSDKDTVVSLTNHAYFNLRGEGTVLDHVVKINGNGVTPLDENLIPTGEIMPVKGTEYDFTEPRVVERPDYDINYVLLPGERENAVVSCPKTGRALVVYSDMPCVQFYVGGMMTERAGKNGKRYGRNSGLCLEPQYFPNGPNVPGFNGGLLMAGQPYRHNIAFEFKTV